MTDTLLSQLQLIGFSADCALLKATINNPVANKIVASDVLVAARIRDSAIIHLVIAGGYYFPTALISAPLSLQLGSDNDIPLDVTYNNAIPSNESSISVDTHTGLISITKRGLYNINVSLSLRLDLMNAHDYTGVFLTTSNIYTQDAIIGCLFYSNKIFSDGYVYRSSQSSFFLKKDDDYFTNLYIKYYGRSLMLENSTIAWDRPVTSNFIKITKLK